MANIGRGNCHGGSAGQVVCLGGENHIAIQRVLMRGRLTLISSDSPKLRGLAHHFCRNWNESKALFELIKTLNTFLFSSSSEFASQFIVSDLRNTHIN